MNFKLSPESNLYRPLGSQVNSTDNFLKNFSFYTEVNGLLMVQSRQNTWRYKTFGKVRGNGTQSLIG